MKEAFRITEKFFTKVASKLWKHRIIMYLLVFGAGTLTAIGVGYLGLYEVNTNLHNLLEMNVWYIYGFSFAVCGSIEVFFRLLGKINHRQIQNIVKAMYICLYFGIIFNFINDLYYVLITLL